MLNRRQPHAMLQLHRSNRLENLAARLADVVSAPLSSPHAAECIVVQGVGMERWLSMRLSERFGVWANPHFPFPRKILRRAIAAVLGEPEERTAPFEPAALSWTVARLLPELVAKPGFEPIASYLREDRRGLRRMRLSTRIAEVLDQYVVFRPGMIAAWESGRDGGWQAELWRSVVALHGRGHVAARIAALVERLRKGSGAIEAFPERISVFGLSALPPLYLDTFVSLSRRLPVHFFIFSPSAEYWSDIRSQREIIREVLASGGELDEAALGLEIGNPLLASLGRVGRDFQGILEAAGDYAEPSADLYADPGTGTMLAAVQSDVLALRHRSAANRDARPIVLDDADDTIAVHACHGKMREVEVLHDQLLDLFERDRSLEPRDVVVMSPAIDDYAPYVDAVFGRPPRDGRPQIPYHVADRTLRATDEVVDAFARLHEVLRSRMGAAQVLDLLAIEPVRERFGIGAEDLDVLREWAGESGIRWGIDAAHRGECRGTPAHENTWRFGLDRLLAGHALRAGGTSLFAGVLPYGGGEGNEDLLGRFVEFCETLFSFRASLAQARTVARWRDDLGELVARMVASTRLNRDQHRRLRKSLETLAERAAVAGFDEPISLDVVHSELELDFRASASSRAFLSRGVTFCALVPMRSIPFRVVCLLGLSDGEFPRIRRPLGFDRLAESRRPGDRSQRDDDRYLFLEALLSARDRLLVTYVGHGIHDNAEYPPSVVVAELLDTIDESFVLKKGSARERIVVHHPLQPFSRRYFAKHGDARLFSYDSAFYEAAARLGEERVERPAFLARPLRPDETSPRAVSVDELARFFENPARGFVRRRLGLWIDDEVRAIDFRDPIEPDALDRWNVAKEMIASHLRDAADGGGKHVAKTSTAVRAGGHIPHGSPGDVFLEDLLQKTSSIAAVVRPVAATERLEPLVVEETVADTRIGGVLRNLWPAAQVFYSYSKLTARHEMAPWIRHLVLCLRQRDGHPRLTQLVGRKKEDDVCLVLFRDVPPDDANKILARLLHVYWLGQTVPLPFFPNAARAYFRALAKEGPSGALVRAGYEYRGAKFIDVAERVDANVKLVFSGMDPLTADGADDMPTFGELAEEVFGDLERYRTSG
jgi:exodeoxyribonuclease V gamma subunit